MARGEVDVPTRVLEAYWSGVAAWLLGRTRHPCRRHREVVGRLRALVLEVGECAVDRRHGLSEAPLCRALDRLAWEVEVADRSRALLAEDLDRLREAIRCMRALA